MFRVGAGSVLREAEPHVAYPADRRAHGGEGRGGEEDDESAPLLLDEGFYRIDAPVARKPLPALSPAPTPILQRAHHTRRYLRGAADPSPRPKTGGALTRH